MITRLAFALLLVVLSAAKASTAAEPVDLELVLAADGSGSIDDDEFRLQRAGYAAAITNPRLLRVIKGGLHGAIALTHIEWGAPDSVATIVGWQVIKDAASAEAFAKRLVSAPRVVEGYNSISAAVMKGIREINTNAYQGVRKIIDVSGDGPQMNGPPMELIRQVAIKAGITINALAIKTPGGGYRGPAGEPLELHYRRDVIGGSRAFVQVARSREHFAEAILKKLIIEVADPTPTGTRTAASDPGPVPAR